MKAYTNVFIASGVSDCNRNVVICLCVHVTSNMFIVKFACFSP